MRAPSTVSDQRVSQIIDALPDASSDERLLFELGARWQREQDARAKLRPFDIGGDYGPEFAILSDADEILIT